MRIRKVATRHIGFSRAAVPMKDLPVSLVTNTSIFEDFNTKPTGWFGPVWCTLVEVEADNGVVGVGTAGAIQGGAKSLIDMYYADLVIGEDPRRHEFLWQRMYRTTARFGRSGTAMAAISALDIACWDLHGKVEGKPVCDLLGGRTRSSAPCYVSRLYALDDLDLLAKEAKMWVELGFTRMKQRFGFGPASGPNGMRRNVDLVRTVRNAVGEEIELSADAYMGWDIGYAIEMAKLLRDFNLTWIEEPLMPHEIDGYAELRRSCPWQRWSCGEHLYGKWEFKNFIDQRAVDILQPDANRAGGLTEVRKICALAEAAGLPVVPHSNEPHNLPIVFSQLPHVCPMVEYFPNVEPDTGNEFFWKMFSGLPEADHGFLRLRDAPGLGVSLREEIASKHQLGETTVTE